MVLFSSLYPYWFSACWISITEGWVLTSAATTGSVFISPCSSISLGPTYFDTLMSSAHSRDWIIPSSNHHHPVPCWSFHILWFTWSEISIITALFFCLVLFGISLAFKSVSLKSVFYRCSQVLSLSPYCDNLLLFIYPDHLHLESDQFQPQPQVQLSPILFICPMSLS